MVFKIAISKCKYSHDGKRHHVIGGHDMNGQPVTP